MSHLLEVTNLQTHFPTRAGLVEAVNDVSFYINEGELLGLIEPGTVIDGELAGPACGDDFVWWLVEVDGIVGWTVESSAPDYYVEPLDGTSFMVTPTLTVTPTNAG